MKESEIEGESKSTKLLANFTFEKEHAIYEIMEIKIRLEKLKILETVIKKIEKIVIPEKYLYHIS